MTSDLPYPILGGEGGGGDQGASLKGQAFVLADRTASHFVGFAASILRAEVAHYG